MFSISSGSLDPVRETRKIFDQRGHRQLAARFMALNDQRFEIGARRVERGGVAQHPEPMITTLRISISQKTTLFNRFPKTNFASSREPSYFFSPVAGVLADFPAPMRASSCGTILRTPRASR